MYYNNFKPEYYGYQQPMQAITPIQPQQTAPKSAQNVEWIYVNGIDGAKNVIVQPSNTAWIMDNNEAKFYVKSSDELGVTTLKAFSFQEIDANNNVVKEEKIDTTNFATKNDLESFKNEIDTIVEKKITTLAKRYLGESLGGTDVKSIV